MSEQLLVFGVLGGALVLFILDRWRYDIVALLALLALTLAGVVPAGEAFLGFGHPAVITVAAILVVSAGLANSGLVDRLSRLLTRVGSNITLQIAALLVVVIVCSAFMNNVGALALLMPVAVRMARHNQISPSVLLMPLAFGSLLGGMMTLIGTPPNIIIGAFRAESGERPFALFDYTPVGAAVAAAGLVFITLVGWRLIPRRRGQADSAEMFHIERYTTELRVPEDSPLVGRPLRELKATKEADLIVLAIVRGRRNILSPDGGTRLRGGDYLIVEVDSEQLGAIVESTGFELAGQKHLSTPDGEDGEKEGLDSEDLDLYQAVVVPRSPLQGKTARELQMRALHGLNLLAVSRQGARIFRRLRSVRFEPGDVLLLQGSKSTVAEALAHLGGLPLAAREIDLGQRRRLVLAVAIFGVAILTLVTRLLEAPVAFAVAAVGMVLTGLVGLREAYRSIDWPVIVLLGAMIPVGGALESTGGAGLIAGVISDLSNGVPLPLVLGALLVLAMFLSDIMNNAATAVIMAPIAVSVAAGLDASPDPFLMAVAVGASCAFLTPIGHQSNTLVMGPGGYRFGDYWRLGLPLEALIVIVSVPIILWVWPA